MSDENYIVLVKEKINNTDYQIVLYKEGFYSLQIKWNDDIGFVDYIVSPKKTECNYEEDETLIEDYHNGGYGDLEYVLKSIYESDRLQKGENWELQLSLQTSEEVIEEFKEIISRSDGEELINKIEIIVELMKDAELYGAEYEVDIIWEIFKVVCYGIIIACFLFLILKFTGNIIG